MSNCPFCNLEASAEPAPPEAGVGKRSAGVIRRAWRRVEWVFPAALLALMPKCPLCVAAYVALFTGVGISVSTARWIQVSMVTLCLSSLGYFFVRYWRRQIKANGAATPSLS
jgi:hypothetical protein